MAYIHYLERLLDNNRYDVEYLTGPWYIGEMNYPDPTPSYTTEPRFNQSGVELRHTHVGQRNFSFQVMRACADAEERGKAIDEIQRFLLPAQERPSRLVRQYDDESRRAIDLRPDPGLGDRMGNDANYNIIGTIEAMSTDAYFYDPDGRVVSFQAAGREASSGFPQLSGANRYDQVASGIENRGDIAIWPDIHVAGADARRIEALLQPGGIIAGMRGRWRNPGANRRLVIRLREFGRMRNTRLNDRLDIVEEGGRIRNLWLAESNPAMFQLKPKRDGYGPYTVRLNADGGSGLEVSLFLRELYQRM